MTHAFRRGQRVVVRGIGTLHEPVTVIADSDDDVVWIRLTDGPAAFDPRDVHPVRDASEVRARKRGEPTMWQRVAERTCVCGFHASAHRPTASASWAHNVLDGLCDEYRNRAVTEVRRG